MNLVLATAYEEALRSLSNCRRQRPRLGLTTLSPSGTTSHATLVLPALNPVGSLVNDFSALSDQRGTDRAVLFLWIAPPPPP